MEIPDQLEEVLTFIVEENEGDNRCIKKGQEMLNELQNGSKVCHMKKALYGLKQAGRAWYKLFDKELRNLGLNPTKSDPCVYTGHTKSGQLMIVVIYVDDILVMTQNPAEIDQFGSKLGSIFEVKDAGDLKHCLGIDFTRCEEGIFISQKRYIIDILQRFNMMESNPVKTPMDCGTKLISGEAWSDSEGEKPPY